MAESLSAEKIAAARANLYAFRYSIGMVDDSELTTTLLMQEEWLATVDELQGYVRDALTLRGIRTRKCLLSDNLGGNDCTDFWKNTSLYCAPCYTRAIHNPDLPAASLKVDPDAFAPLPLHGVVLDDPGRLDTPFRRDKPAPRPLSVGPDFAEYHGGIPKVQEWTEEECETLGQAHVWVKLGKVGLTDKGLSAMDWGDPECLRCGIPEPEED
ncbi:hypothetical protein LCGC14_1494060 [marine sediment metagenome]|uniref:Uncharacterized protein n=1 Tax=marine sediment metagenome TaxID=412755 RepID=A0A0F9J6H6_9ZZZZ